MTYFFVTNIEILVLNFSNFLVKTKEFARLPFDMVSLQEETKAFNMVTDKEMKVFISV